MPKNIKDVSPKAEKGDQMHVKSGTSKAVSKSPRPKPRPDTVDVSPKREKGDQQHIGRGTKGQSSGKGFKGTF